ncbi:MAG: hypothetical protein A2Z34_04945 [Planctomycetes bacterium RBG_16_59_8]|nr:MAG: hypothetical protein A2Z34_04945 [Planctomycetes bacterium RBG_16_59_8]
MTDAEFVQHILAMPAESRTVEFKRLGISRNEAVDRTLQSIVAMANTDGGVIILGVDDPEKSRAKGLDRVFGIEENTEGYDELGRNLRKIAPPIANLWPPVTIHVKEKNCRIALLSIPKVSDHFRTIESRVWIRLERGNKCLSPSEIVHFAYIKGFQRADIELVDVDFDLLKTPFFDAWRRKRGFADDDHRAILHKTGLARNDENGRPKPTRAAVLLFAEYPNDLMDSKCAIRLFEYAGRSETVRGETINLLGTPTNIHGPVIKQIADAQSCVLNLLKAGLRVPSGFVTQYRIPERALREAITNAVIHRDYGSKRDIEIRLFEDRVEVESPGLLPFNITPSNIGHERALGYRNDLLVKHLREFPDPPNLDQNEGVRIMRQQMKDAHLYPPVFQTYPRLQDSVRVILWNESSPTEWEKVHHLLTKQKYVVNAEVRGILGIADSVRVSKLLSQWVGQGLLTKIVPRPGAKRNVRYRLPDTQDLPLFSFSRTK